jgi:SNF2 family DNA or RNA helicase
MRQQGDKIVCVQVSLLNIMMQLRKTCNHADLIQEGEPSPFSTAVSTVPAE